MQFGFYRLLLRGPLQTRDAKQMRPALGRWLKVVLAWQVLVVALAAAYVAVVASGHPRGFAWIAPPIGALFGTALPLQFIVMAILRSSRGS